METGVYVQSISVCDVKKVLILHHLLIQVFSIIDAVVDANRCVLWTMRELPLSSLPPRFNMEDQLNYHVISIMCWIQLWFWFCLDGAILFFVAHAICIFQED